MPDKETVITHLTIIRTWASFARERDLQFFTAKHLEDMAQWADEAIALLKEQNKIIQNILLKKANELNDEDRNSTEQKSMENVIHLYDNYYVGTCPSCGKAFSTNGGTAIFCKYCGQAVRWE